MTVDVDVASANGILVHKVLECLKNHHSNRILIAVAGVPGSGKSTVANGVCQVLNLSGLVLENGDKVEAVVVGMDGFHLTRHQLQQMEDPTYAFIRRGAPFTFDDSAFVRFVTDLHNGCKMNPRPVVYAPSFDHKVKDPIENDVVIPLSANVVIIEGLYTLLDMEPWCRVAKLVHQSWFVKVDAQLARDRLARRHFEAGIEPTLEASYKRIDTNDAINAELILGNLVPGIDVVIN